jgi:hypothetical protein
LAFGVWRLAFGVFGSGDCHNRPFGFAQPENWYEIACLALAQTAVAMVVILAAEPNPAPDCLAIGQLKPRKCVVFDDVGIAPRTLRWI